MKIKDIIIFGALVLIVVYLVSSWFINTSDTHYLNVIKAKDETIKAITSERDKERELKDYVISELHKKDSLLQTRYKTNTIIYEKIPVTVANYSDDELKRAVENYR